MQAASRAALCKLLAVFVGLATTTAAIADSSSARLAAYYDRKILLCGTTAFQWNGSDVPQKVASDLVQVGVGQDTSYGLTTTGALVQWRDAPGSRQQLMDRINWFAAGDSGLFAMDSDDTLWFLAQDISWFLSGKKPTPMVVANSVKAASIGDSANYYVTQSGTLFVAGLAHRGQYGDGNLKASQEFIPVADTVAAVKAHTGHAILLTSDGVVMGTGGNIYGPLGRHGLGDKATVWGEVFSGATAIATGSSHSVAIDADGSLWAWGRGIGLDPVQKMQTVIAVAADRSGTIALKADNSLWQWDRGQPPQLHFKCP